MSRPRSHDYAQVAEVYVEALEAGDPPTKAVQDTWGLTRSAAAKLVARVRAAGHLPATTQGVTGGFSPKVYAVAHALGVEPEALHEAVIKHADGDLRIAQRPTVQGR